MNVLRPFAFEVDAYADRLVRAPERLLAPPLDRLPETRLGYRDGILRGVAADGPELLVEDLDRDLAVLVETVRVHEHALRPNRRAGSGTR